MLDISNGVICGLDVVVWPEVSTSPTLQVPARLTDGRVVLPSRPSRPGVASMEVDTTLSVETNAAESVFHLRIGMRRQVEVVRVADNFYIEVDQQGGLVASGSRTCRHLLRSKTRCSAEPRRVTLRAAKGA